MKTVVAWAIGAAAGLVLLSACGGGDGEGMPPSTQETPTPGVTAEATAEVVEEEPPDLSDVSFVENLLAKVDAGEWTLGEGLVATLKLFAGELDAASVLRHPDLIRPEGTGVFKMAYEYLDDGHDAEAKGEITRLLDLLVFSNDQLEAMAGLGAPTAALPGQLPLGAARGPEENCKDFFKGYVLPPGVGQCLEVGISDFLEDFYTGQYRVFFPAPPLPSAGWTEKHYNLALQAMEKTVPEFKKLGNLPAANVVFSVSAGGGNFASAAPTAGKPCGVAVHTSMQGKSDADFKQIIAHELGHCFQTENFPEQNKVKYEIVKWREEGLAEYLSNVAYPTNNLEHRDWLGKLAQVELKTTLFDRAYTNFIWFQYLANFIGHDGLFALIKTLPKSGGRGEQVAALAQYSGIDEIYHDFARAMTDEEIADTGVGLIPYEISETNRPTVRITAPATPLVQRNVKPFGVVRRRLLVEEDKHATLDFNGKGLVHESARPSEDWTEWSEVPSELPDEDCNPEIILVATTTEPDSGFDLDVPAVADVVGAGGLEGEWAVDNDSIGDRIRSRFPETKVDSIGGEIRATFRDDGKVEVVYDGFEVSGHSEGDSVLARVLGEPELYTEHTITTDARGTTSYRTTNLPPGDFIEFGSSFEASYLEGTETVEYYRGTYELAFGEPDVIPVDEIEETREEEPSGTDLFSSLQEYALQCQGTILRLEDAILHRVGLPD